MNLGLPLLDRALNPAAQRRWLIFINVGLVGIFWYITVIILFLWVNMSQSQYSESAWFGKQPDSYQPDLPVLPKLPPTPPWMKKLSVGLSILFVVTISTATVAAMFTLILFFSSGFFIDRILNNSALELVVIAWLISLVLIIVTVILFRVMEKQKQYCDMKYDDFAGRFTQSMSLSKWIFNGMNIPTTTMGFMELTPSVWKKRGMADKFGRTFFDWNHVKLSVYEYSTTRLKTSLKICRVINFFVFPLFGWAYILQMINEDVFLPPYILLLALQTLLLFSGRLIYGGEKQVKVYEFNRHTGQIIKFDPSGNQIWSYPFYEFNAYIRYCRPEAKRPASYTLYMTHRHSPHWTAKDMVYLCCPWTTHSDRNSITELMDTLIAFMNVTLPLPQCIALQACRHLDSTTQKLEPHEADNKIDFLSMSDKEYKDTMFQFWKERQSTY